MFEDEELCSASAKEMRLDINVHRRVVDEENEFIREAKACGHDDKIVMKTLWQSVNHVFPK